MPRQFAMSWEGHPHYRWVKMYRGSRYRVNCTDLPIDRTKYTREGSASAANSWWEAKRLEIDVATHQAHPRRERLDELAAQREYAQREGLAAEAERLATEYELVEDGLVGDVPLSTLERAADFLSDAKIPAKLSDIPPPVMKEYFGDSTLWTDRQRRTPPTPPGRTFGELAKRWLDRRRQKHQAGGLSISGTAQSKYRLDHFVTWVKADTPAAEITAPRWEEWYLHLQGQVAGGTISNDWGKNLYATSKQFVRWLYETEVLDRLPRNFDSIRWEGTGAKDIQVFEVRDVTAMLAAATPRVRLYLFLMLSAGMYQSDISDLRRVEVDLEAGKITRKRSKTRDQEGVPGVTYTVWPEAVELLREYMAQSGEYALLNEDGQRLVRERLKDDGTHSKTDAIRLAFDRLKDRCGVAGTIKLFRKTSASLLNRYPEFQGIVPYFLGHSPRGMSKTHYTRESDELLAQATARLRDIYGVEKLGK
jgi:integrase